MYEKKHILHGKERKAQMHYSICNKKKKVLIAKAIAQAVIGISFFMGGILPLGMIWWARILVAGVGFFISTQSYYEFKYFIGAEREGLFIDEEDKAIVYFDEFNGIRTIELSSVQAIKIYRNNKEVIMFEIRYAEDTKLKDDNINLSGFSLSDNESLIETVTKLFPEISISNTH